MTRERDTVRDRVHDQDVLIHLGSQTTPSSVTTLRWVLLTLSATTSDVVYDTLGVSWGVESGNSTYGYHRTLRSGFP